GRGNLGAAAADRLHPGLAAQRRADPLGGGLSAGARRSAAARSQGTRQRGRHGDTRRRCAARWQLALPAGSGALAGTAPGAQRCRTGRRLPVVRREPVPPDGLLAGPAGPRAAAGRAVALRTGGGLRPKGRLQWRFLQKWGVLGGKAQGRYRGGVTQAVRAAAVRRGTAGRRLCRLAHVEAAESLAGGGTYQPAPLFSGAVGAAA